MNRRLYAETRALENKRIDALANGDSETYARLNARLGYSESSIENIELHEQGEAGLQRPRNEYLERMPRPPTRPLPIRILD